MQTGEIIYQGKKLFYRMAGEGPLVVLLHGFGEDGAIWKGQYDIFPRHRLLVPDLPGSGRSEAIEDMSIEGLADAVKAMIEAFLPSLPLTPSKGGGIAYPQSLLTHDGTSDLVASKSEAGASGHSSFGGAGGDPGGTILIGHSMGGYITMAFAERHPELLSAFGLFHSTAFADSEEKKEGRKKGIRFMEEHGAAEFLKTATPNLYAPGSKEQHPEWIEEHLAAVHNFSDQNLVSYYKAMIQRPDRTLVLKETLLPVLFILGRHDMAVPLQDGLKQSYIPQLSYIHILEDAGHMGMIEVKDEANVILSQFVNTIEITA